MCKRTRIFQFLVLSVYYLFCHWHFADFTGVTLVAEDVDIDVYAKADVEVDFDADVLLLMLKSCW